MGAAHPVVLLVSPYPDELVMYSEFLASRGFMPIACNNIESAMNCADQVDAVVTGIAVETRDDGLNFARWLREQPATREKRIVILTAHATQSDRNLALLAGCDRLVLKPCSPPELVAILRNVLAEGSGSNEGALGRTPP